MPFDRWLLLALAHFGERDVAVVLLETGIGGLHDSTNFVPEPALSLSVITSISADHQWLLGDTLELIAEQKVGRFVRSTKSVFFRSATRGPSCTSPYVQ